MVRADLDNRVECCKKLSPNVSLVDASAQRPAGLAEAKQSWHLHSRAQ